MTGLPDRLREVRQFLKETQKGMARRLGMGDTTWQRYELGSNIPGADVLEQVAALGFSGNWLLTGQGSMRKEEADTEPAPVQPPRVEMDEELHGRIVEGINAAYKDAGARISARDLGRLAARLHADVAATGLENWEAKMGALSYALQQLRRDLQTAPAPDAENKRLA